MAETQPILAGINQIALASEDPPKLAEFYKEKLGLAVLFETAGMIFFQSGQARLMIGPRQSYQTIGGDAVIYFEPADWDGAVSALETKGVAFTHAAQPLQREGGRTLMLRAFKDPEGHTLALLGWRED
jgi:methylmalonyl-CoA/ethylmalonyl-CoA epimerase